MYLLPPTQTPLNRHSLLALETWLEQLGAKRSSSNPSLWIWQRAQWSAEIEIGQADLIVIWDKNNLRSQCSFPYGLSRQDVEAAIKEGP